MLAAAAWAAFALAGSPGAFDGWGALIWARGAGWIVATGLGLVVLAVLRCAADLRGRRWSGRLAGLVGMLAVGAALGWYRQSVMALGYAVWWRYLS